MDAYHFVVFYLQEEEEEEEWIMHNAIERKNTSIVNIKWFDSSKLACIPAVACDGLQSIFSNFCVC